LAVEDGNIFIASMNNIFIASINNIFIASMNNETNNYHLHNVCRSHLWTQSAICCYHLHAFFREIA
jgi:hypothetical protein